VGKLAVVGALGALGYSAVQIAAASGGARAIVRHPREGFFGPEIEVMRADAAEPEAMKRAIDGCEALLFCVNVPIAAWAEVMPGLLDVACEACRSSGCRLVFPGNVWIYGPGPQGSLVDETLPASPTSRKGQLRATLESRLRASGAPHAIVRLPEFYGPNVANRLMGRPILDAIAGRSVMWPGGRLDVEVEFVFMPDGARAMVEVARAEGVDGETFHVPGAEHTTPRAFFEEVLTAAGSKGTVRTLPNALVHAASLFSKDAHEFAERRHLAPVDAARAA
jgi:nucleoside-diphosphate-sugar epimerase